MTKQSNLTFIAGYPRSGTTWFSNILNSHPEFIYRHEVLGRLYNSIPENIFVALKDGSLSEQDRIVLLEKLRNADVETDRPPFFDKSYLRISNTSLHHKAWLVAKTASPLNALYRWLYTPKAEKGRLLIKETRSTVNMDGILGGLRPSQVLFIFRHPFGVVNSVFRGRQKGLMEDNDDEVKLEWYQSNIEGVEKPYADLTKDKVFNLSTAAFFAHQWCKHNLDFFEFAENHPSIFVNYDQLLDDTLPQIESLFAQMDLQVMPSTRSFLSESTSTNSSDKSILKRDSLDSFYSVFRDKSSLDNEYKALSSEDKDCIEEICTDVLSKLQARCDWQTKAQAAAAKS